MLILALLMLLLGVVTVTVIPDCPCCMTGTGTGTGTGFDPCGFDVLYATVTGQFDCAGKPTLSLPLDYDSANDEWTGFHTYGTGDTISVVVRFRFPNPGECIPPGDLVRVMRVTVNWSCAPPNTASFCTSLCVVPSNQTIVATMAAGACGGCSAGSQQLTTVISL